MPSSYPSVDCGVNMRTPLALIAAMTKDRVIGYHNKLPWQLPEELQYFREMTLGKPMIMGHKTFLSMGSRPLPKRQNIVLSRDPSVVYSHVQVVRSLEEALAVAEPATEIMIIGGSQIYALCLPMATRLYLSFIEGDYQGDTFFPQVDWSAWDLRSEKAMEGFSANIFQRKIPQ
jgi:dihydrofolate reductase